MMSDTELITALKSEWTQAQASTEQTIEQRLDAKFTEKYRKFAEQNARFPMGGNTDSGGNVGESLGTKFIGSTEYRALMGAPGQRGRAVIAAAFTKATTLTNAQIKPAPARAPDILPMPTLPPAVVALIGWRPVASSDTVSFLRESAAAAPGAKSQLGEGALKTEQTITVELITEAVETIAAWTSCSTQALSDTAQLSRFIDEVLTRLVLTEIDRQVLNGTGSAAHELVGIVPSATAYDTARTLAGDGPLDVISHAQAQLYAANVVATAVVLSPADAEVVKLSKTTDGVYLWGTPSAGAPASVWGLTPVVDGNLASGFIVGDFSARSIELLVREEAITELSREHSDYFTRNLAALRTEARCANGLYRPAAFVTGGFPPPAGRGVTVGSATPRK